MPLRIMHVNLAKGFRGGERQTELLITALADKGIVQFLVCRHNSPLRSRLSTVPNLTFITANHQLMGHIRTPAVDLVHAHEAKAVHWAWLHHWIYDTPYILTRRVPQPVKTNSFNRRCYSAASMAVAISNPIEKHLLDRGWCQVRRIPSVLAHLPQDPQQVMELKANYRGGFIIGHVGALVDKHKGQRDLIRAAKLLAGEIPNARFLMLGDGVDAENLKAESQDLPNMEWLGFKNNLGDYFAMMDLFAFPSRNEGLGSTLLDAMDYSVPIVASDVDGIPDLVTHEKTGLLVAPNNAEALAAAILRLYHDEALRTKLAENAKAQLSNFTPKAMAASYLKLYQELLSR